jgi:hypothetical protein
MIIPLVSRWHVTGKGSLGAKRKGFGRVWWSLERPRTLAYNQTKQSSVENARPAAKGERCRAPTRKNDSLPRVRLRCCRRDHHAAAEMVMSRIPIRDYLRDQINLDWRQRRMINRALSLDRCRIGPIALHVVDDRCDRTPRPLLQR